MMLSARPRGCDVRTAFLTVVMLQPSCQAGRGTFQTDVIPNGIYFYTSAILIHRSMTHLKSMEIDLTNGPVDVFMGAPVCVSSRSLCCNDFLARG